MIIKREAAQTIKNRQEYPIYPLQERIKHFAVWTTTPDTPFKPHKHELEEFWYILEGEAIVTLNGEEQRVEPGDLIFLPPWKEHGLRTESFVRWICLG